MDAKAEHAIRFVMKHEGGWTVDHAGPTNYGITLRALQATNDLAQFDIDLDGDIDAADLRVMTPERAMAYYHQYWWLANGYGSIQSPEVAAKVMDLSVNMGARQAHRLLQRALRACEHPVADDGIFGPKTLDATNAAHPRILLSALRSEAAGFYRGLCDARHDFVKYKTGWLNRAYA